MTERLISELRPGDRACLPGQPVERVISEVTAMPVRVAGVITSTLVEVKFGDEFGELGRVLIADAAVEVSAAPWCETCRDADDLCIECGQCRYCGDCDCWSCESCGEVNDLDEDQCSQCELCSGCCTCWMCPDCMARYDSDGDESCCAECERCSGCCECPRCGYCDAFLESEGYRCTDCGDLCCEEHWNTDCQRCNSCHRRFEHVEILPTTYTTGTKYDNSAPCSQCGSYATHRCCGVDACTDCGTHWR